MSLGRLDLLFLILYHSKMTLKMWKQEQMDCQVFFCKAGSVIVSYTRKSGLSVGHSIEMHLDKCWNEHSYDSKDMESFWNIYLRSTFIHTLCSGWQFFFISSLYDTIGCLTYPDFNIRYYKGTGDTLEIFLDFTNIFWTCRKSSLKINI